MGETTDIEMAFIDTGHPLYAAELDLRFRALRQPLGFARSATPSQFEGVSLHLVALADQEVLGCVLFRNTDQGCGQLFQMAVEPRVQRHGLGTRLLAVLETELIRREITEVMLHAREPAIPFYQRAGYTTFGEPFVEVGVPHRRMQKQLHRPQR